MKKDLVKIKLHKPRGNWLGLTKWIKVYSKFNIHCCDCGLVHEFWFRNIKGKLMWRVKRKTKLTNFIKRQIKNEKTKI